MLCIVPFGVKWLVNINSFTGCHKRPWSFILGFPDSQITDDGTRQAKGSWHFRKRFSKEYLKDLLELEVSPRQAVTDLRPQIRVFLAY